MKSARREGFAEGWAFMAKLAVGVDEQDHLQGPADAPATLVEYGDYECPSCGEAYAIVKQVQKHFGKKLRFVFRNFPLPMHPMAEPAAEAAEFADSEGKFWPMHDLLFENQDELSEELFASLGEELGLSAKDLAKAVSGHKSHARIKADLASGEKSGLRGTPTFYINGAEHRGSYDYESLVEAIDAVLEG